MSPYVPPPATASNGGATTPTLVLGATTYTIPEDTQLVGALAIKIDGTLKVIGTLVMIP